MVLFNMCLGEVVVTALTLRSRSGSFDPQLLHFQVQLWASSSHTCLCHPSSSLTWYRPMNKRCSTGGKANCTFDVRLATCHRQYQFIQLWVM